MSSASRALEAPLSPAGGEGSCTDDFEDAEARRKTVVGRVWKKEEVYCQLLELIEV